MSGWLCLGGSNRGRSIFEACSEWVLGCLLVIGFFFLEDRKGLGVLYNAM